MLNLGAMYRLPDMGVIYMYNIPTKWAYQVNNLSLWTDAKIDAQKKKTLLKASLGIFNGYIISSPCIFQVVVYIPINPQL